MSLVAYGSSDESSDGDEQLVQDKSNQKKSKTTENGSIDSEISTTFSELPSSIHHNATTATGSKVKISIPSLTEFEEDDEDSGEPKRKKLIQSEKGSGLVSLLPVPKNQFLCTPSQVVKRLKNSKLPEKIKDTSVLGSKEDDATNDSVVEDFFSLSSNDNVAEVACDITGTENDEEGSSVMGPVFQQLPTTEIPYAQVDTNEIYLPTEPIIEPITPNEKPKRRDRNQIPEDVKFIEIDGNKIFAECKRSFAKNRSEEMTTKPEPRRKQPEPSSNSKRKHQITYLAHQARERELELKNQWANNRFTRKQTQSKYGF